MVRKLSILLLTLTAFVHLPTMSMETINPTDLSNQEIGRAFAAGIDYNTIRLFGIRKSNLNKYITAAQDTKTTHAKQAAKTTAEAQRQQEAMMLRMELSRAYWNR